jgi:hypothetical protein
MDRAVTRSLASRLFPAGSPQAIALLRATWFLVVGPELARRTEPISLEQGTLRVRVPDARWRKALHKMQGQILPRLREVAGELAPRRLGFLEGPVPETAEAARTPAKVEATAAPAAVATAAEAIPDAELRALFLAAAARYLSRGSSGGSSHA